jgi:hypothetical protein
VYHYGTGGGFPTSSYGATNYWVDPVLRVSADTTPPTVTAQSPAAGATGVALGSEVAATFSEPVQPGTISIVVKDPNGQVVSGSASYDSSTKTVTFSPSAALAALTTYTVTVSGAQDPAGNTMTSVSWSFTTRNPVNQITISNFSGGTFNGTWVNPNGALALTPGTVDDFSGTQLKVSTWVTTNWTTSSAIAVSGGLLSLQGAQLVSAANFAGLAIDGSINFGASPYQYFGLGTGFDTVGGNYWAVFGTASTTNTLFARVNASGVTQDVNLGALPSGFHTYRVEPITTGFNFYVDGSLKTTIALTFPTGTPLPVILSSYTGTSSPALQVDWIRGANYPSTGTYVSAVIDVGQTANWATANWTANLPAGTSITVETMTSNDGTNWSSWAAVTNNQIASPPGRYFLFRITFTTNDPTLTPELSNISFVWT